MKESESNVGRGGVIELHSRTFSFLYLKEDPHNNYSNCYTQKNYEEKSCGMNPNGIRIGVIVIVGHVVFPFFI